MAPPLVGALVNAGFALHDFNQFKNDPQAIARQQEMTKYYTQKYGRIGGLGAEVLQESFGQHYDVLKDKNASLADKTFATMGLIGAAAQLPITAVKVISKRLYAGDGSEDREIFGDDINETGQLKQTETFVNEDGVLQERFVEPPKNSPQAPGSKSPTVQKNKGPVQKIYGEKAAMETRNWLARNRAATNKFAEKESMSDQEVYAWNKFVQNKALESSQQVYNQAYAKNNTVGNKLSSWWSNTDKADQKARDAQRAYQMKKTEEMKKDPELQKKFIQEYRRKHPNNAKNANQIKNETSKAHINDNSEQTSSPVGKYTGKPIKSGEERIVGQKGENTYIVESQNGVRQVRMNKGYGKEDSTAGVENVGHQGIAKSDLDEPGYAKPDSAVFNNAVFNNATISGSSGNSNNVNDGNKSVSTLTAEISNATLNISNASISDSFYTPTKFNQKNNEINSGRGDSNQNQQPPQPQELKGEVTITLDINIEEIKNIVKAMAPEIVTLGGGKPNPTPGS